MSFQTDHKAKKRKLDENGESNRGESFRSSTRFKADGGREWTISIALPGSIIADCATGDQRMTSPGRIARSLAVFSVDEVIIFDDSPPESRPPAVDHHAYTGDTDPCHYIAHVLNYLEAPPFMRKALFPLHPNLRLVGLLPGLEMPHHPHKDEWLPYREGFTTKGTPSGGKGTLVDVGLKELVSVPEKIPPNTRVTLEFSGNSNTAEPVHPAAPRTDAGYYWGYTVRNANSLSNVFTECPYEGGYDISIGTSERGLAASRAFPPSDKPPSFNHLLIVFGGPRGLEYAAMNDPELGGMGISAGRTRELFDHWVNILPNQGSRTIRTDEAVFIALTGLRRLWDDN